MPSTTKTEPKAIETVYDGYRFRSRIEAKWATFFNALGIKYEYEKETYDLGKTLYLPDFWLPEHGCWVEVKGAFPSPGDVEKAALLADETETGVFIFFGTIPYPDRSFKSSEPVEVSLEGDKSAWAKDHSSCMGEAILVMGMMDEAGSTTGLYTHQRWLQCPMCRTLFIDGYPLSRGCDCDSPDAITHDTPQLMSAYAAARQARFEWGETPIYTTKRETLNVPRSYGRRFSRPRYSITTRGN